MPYPVRVKFIVRSRPTEVDALAKDLKSKVSSTVDVETNPFHVAMWAHTDVDAVMVYMTLSDTLHSMSWFEDTGQGFVPHREDGPASVFWRGPDRQVIRNFNRYGLNLTEEAHDELRKQGLTSHDDVLDFLSQ